MNNNLPNRPIYRKGLIFAPFTNILGFKYFRVPANAVLVQRTFWEDRAFVTNSGPKVIPPGRKFQMVEKNNLIFNIPAKEMECADRIKPTVDIIINAQIMDPSFYTGNPNPNGVRPQKDPDGYLLTQVMSRVEAFVKALDYEDLEYVAKQTASNKHLSDCTADYQNPNGQTESIGFRDIMHDIEAKTGIRIISIDLEKLKSPQQITNIMEQRVVVEEQNRQAKAKADNENAIAVARAKADLEVADLNAQAYEKQQQMRNKLTREQIIFLTEELDRRKYSREEIIRLIVAFNDNPNSFTSNLISSGNNDLLNAFMGFVHNQQNNNGQQPVQQYQQSSQPYQQTAQQYQQSSQPYQQPAQQYQQPIVNPNNGQQFHRH